MKTIDLVTIGALLFIFFLIMDQESFKGWKEKAGIKEETQEGASAPPPPRTDGARSAQSVPNFESSFEQGLPEEYSPRDPSTFPSVEKLRGDLEYRRKKLEYAIQEERRELGALDASGEEKSLAFEALGKKHAAARQELDRKHGLIMEEYRRLWKEEALRNQGLR